MTKVVGSIVLHDNASLGRARAVVRLDSWGMGADPDLVETARAEAEAIVAEAREQAGRLLAAAEQKRSEAESEAEGLKEAGRELAANLEGSIRLLTQVLEELRRQLN